METPSFWLWNPYSHISSADLQSKGGFAACPPSCRGVPCPGKGQAAVGIVVDAGGWGPASLAILYCSPTFPAVQHPVTPLFCFKEDPSCLTCSRVWHCLWTHHFSYIVKFGWVNILTRFHLVFSSPFSTTVRLVLTPLCTLQIVNTIYPKSSCFEVFLPFFDFWRGLVTWIGDPRRVHVGAALGKPPTLSPFLLHMAYGLEKGIWASGASGTLMQKPHSVSLKQGPGQRHLGINEEKGMEKHRDCQWDCCGAQWKGRWRNGWKFCLQTCFAYHIKKQNWILIGTIQYHCEVHVK